MMLGTILAVSFLVLIVKTGWFRRILPFHPVIDIAASLVFMAALGGTVAGVWAALLLGLLP